MVCGNDIHTLPSHNFEASYFEIDLTEKGGGEIQTVKRSSILRSPKNTFSPESKRVRKCISFGAVHTREYMNENESPSLQAGGIGLYPRGLRWVGQTSQTLPSTELAGYVFSHPGTFLHPAASNLNGNFGESHRQPEDPNVTQSSLHLEKTKFHVQPASPSSVDVAHYPSLQIHVSQQSQCSFSSPQRLASSRTMPAPDMYDINTDIHKPSRFASLLEQSPASSGSVPEIKRNEMPLHLTLEIPTSSNARHSFVDVFGDSLEPYTVLPVHAPSPPPATHAVAKLENEPAQHSSNSSTSVSSPPGTVYQTSSLVQTVLAVTDTHNAYYLYSKTSTSPSMTLPEWTHIASPSLDTMLIAQVENSLSLHRNNSSSSSSSSSSSKNSSNNSSISSRSSSNTSSISSSSIPRHMNSLENDMMESLNRSPQSVYMSPPSRSHPAEHIPAACNTAGVSAQDIIFTNSISASSKGVPDAPRLLFPHERRNPSTPPSQNADTSGYARPLPGFRSAPPRRHVTAAVRLATLDRAGVYGLQGDERKILVEGSAISEYCPAVSSPPHQQVLQQHWT